MICRFCGENDEENFEYDSINNGFWCEACDGYNYIPTIGQNRHDFILILEDKLEGEKVEFKPEIKLKKQLSPLRYPGGKSKLIDYIYSKVDLFNTDTFVEPFAGGASVGLSLLEAGVINNLVLNDLDFGIYSLFYIIKNDPNLLIDKVKTFKPTHRDYYFAQEKIKSKYKGCTILESAWYLLLVNRLAYSGICKAGPMGGKKGTINKLLVRWNPSNLINRIKAIHAISENITILNVDASELIEEMYWERNTTIFIDPPYYKKGKDLYSHYFNEQEHIKLSLLLDSLYKGVPGADILVTYDNHKFIEEIYEFPKVEKISRIYSI